MYVIIEIEDNNIVFKNPQMYSKKEHAIAYAIDIIKTYFIDLEDESENIQNILSQAKEDIINFSSYSAGIRRFALIKISPEITPEKTV